jgi:xanthine/CO dehydrogenase XdhC/CoxF family maturation factor
MRELFDIFAMRRRWPDEPMALATVVRVEGSNFRRAGARMLVHANGTCVGSVSGGCLEQDVIEHTRQMFANPAGPRQLVYDTTVPDDLLFGTGSGCKGRVTLQLELLPPYNAAGPNDWLIKTEAYLLEGTACLVASLIDGPADCPPPRTLTLSIEGAVDEAKTVFGISLPAQDIGATTFLSGSVQGKPLAIFIQRLEPQPLLLISGAGPTARPLATICAQIGWKVKVIDWRKPLLEMSPFPDDTLVEHIASWSEYDFTAADGAVAAVVMTHRWDEDRVAMRGLLQRPLSYLGLMGSHKRCADLLDTLGQNLLNKAPLSTVDAPAGVPLGAEGPEEIAVSIAARLIAATRKTPRVVT